MKSQQLYNRGRTLIPGGTQLLSKRPEMFAPAKWPSYFSKAKGVKVWDLDGLEYTDMSIMGVGACILGYADDDVDDAVIRAIKNGIASSLNCPEEIELAELLIELHPWAEMVRFTRGGGEAMSVAVRVARAATQRDLVLFSGYHGWTDWYLAANLGETNALDGHLMPGLQPTGVPRGLRGSSQPFPVNDIGALKDITRGREKEVAAVVIEPARGEEAPPGYLAALKDYAKEIGAVLIFDEITSGFRMNVGGIHIRYGVNPDIAVFAKSIANGYAMAAVIGRESVMQGAQKTFISSTNWTERVGLAAAIATIRKYRAHKVHEHIISIGNEIQLAWSRLAQKHDLDVHVTGLPTLGAFSFNSPNNQVMQTLYVIGMLKRGFLGFRQFKPSFAHTLENVKQYSSAVDSVFQELKRDDIEKSLATPVAHSGFSRLTKE